MKIKKNDTVQIIAGKDRGKTGKVLVVYPRLDQVLVEGMNTTKKTKKQTKTEKGGVVEISRPIHVSNVMVVDPKTNAPTRIGIVRGEDGKRTRVTKKSGTTLT